MNILYTNFHPGDGGGHTAYILTLLQNPKHNKYVACPPGSLLYKRLEEQGYDKLIGIDFYGKLREFKGVWENARLLKKAVEKFDIDIIHTNGSPDSRMALLIAPFTKKFKLVHTKHNLHSLKNFFSRFRFNYFNDAIIFVGDTLNQLNLDRNHHKYHIIPNGIDLDYWKRTIPYQENHRITLISNAGANKNKGWTHLIEAINLLKEEERKRINIVMLARKNHQIESMINNEATSAYFSCPGFIKDVRPYLEKADIGFVLSYQEACSFACREMLAMGLPVIVSDYPVLINNINDECGWITKTGDANSIKGTLQNILKMPLEKLRVMQQAARKKAEADFAFQDMIAKTDAIYEKISSLES